MQFAWNVLAASAQGGLADLSAFALVELGGRANPRPALFYSEGR
jgi:hypothetical protein